MIYIWLMLGLFLLAWGGDVMVNGSVALAKRLGVASLLIGLTLVGFGTSTPELLTSLIAVYKGSEGIAVGNVVGSNIYNALFILGVTALFMPVIVPQSMTPDVVLMTLVTAVLIGVAFWKKQFSRRIGFAFLCAYAGYTYYLYTLPKVS